MILQIYSKEIEKNIIWKISNKLFTWNTQEMSNIIYYRFCNNKNEGVLGIK